MPKFVIKKKHHLLFIHSTIDSSGMDVFWTKRDLADEFASEKSANEFAARILERNPSTELEVISDA